MEDVLASVYRQTQALHEELNARIEGTQLGLLESLSMRTRSLRKKMEDTMKDFHEAIADTRKDLPEELYFRIQATQAQIETSRREFQTQLKEVEVLAARVAGQYSTT
jgi:hypothetical protein